MTQTELATPEEIRKAFKCDPSTGQVYFNKIPKGRGYRPHLAGTLVQVRPDNNGRLRLNYRRRKYLVHRVIWCLVHQSWPDDMIDHINGDPQDNRIVNLRPVTNKLNCRNQKLRKNNKSGTMGVQWRKDRQQWIAVIASNGKRRSLGFFDELDDAVQARRTAERDLGFHPNHGKR